jgi:TolB-like protein
MGEDEAGTLDALKSLRKDLVAPKIAKHKGRIVKLMGDGLLAEFSSVVEAVECAVAIQAGMPERNAETPSERQVVLRIGINLGDVIVEGRDIYGDGVNIAARLEGLAEPGGICISDTVQQNVRAKLDLAFEDLGAQQFKNIVEPVHAYRVIFDASIALSGPPDDQSLPLPLRPSVAVLPFTNMSGDPEQEYFSDGITEDIITELSRFKGVLVIARNSTFYYKNKALDLRQIGKDLGVRYILEGSVRRAGQRLRVTAQLIETVGGSHLWAERYDRNLVDIFDLQDELTRDVVGAIAPQIELAELDRARTTKNETISAYDMALKAQAIFHESIKAGDPAISEQAIDTALKALSLDDKSPRGLWIFAFTRAIQYLYRWHAEPDVALEEAWQAANRLMELDATEPSAYMVRGLVNQFRREFDDAVTDYHSAFDINPNFAQNLFLMAWCESTAGLLEEAKTHADMALRLSPRDSEHWVGDAYLAKLQAFFAEGDYEEAAKWGALAVKMTPKAPIRRALMNVCCNETGRPEEAARHAEALQLFAPDFIPSILRGDFVLYKLPEHNALLVEGLSKAGFRS